MPTIFITGASGYVGGHTLNLIAKVHPEWNVVTLVRTKGQARIIRERWPTVLAVVGNLDNHILVSELGTSADVVLQLASSEHSAAGEAIIAGMGRGKKGHFIQMTGICSLQNNLNGYGNPSDMIYLDNECIEFPSNSNQKCIEHFITAAGITHGVSTDIVCPAIIYGKGQGPIRKRSTHIPFLIEAILRRGKGFTVGRGENIMSSIHIDDVASALIALTIQALCQNSNSHVSSSSHYFLGTSETSLDEVTRAIVRAALARKAIYVAVVESLDPGQAAQIHPWAPLLWGTNCRGRPHRLRALGWEPKGPCLIDALPEMVDFEIKLLAAQKHEYVQTWQTDVEYPVEEKIF